MSDYYSKTPMADLLIKLDQISSAREWLGKVNRNQWPAKGNWGWDDDKRFYVISKKFEEEAEQIITQINILVDDHANG